MSIGRISPKKGLENLISAMALLGPEVSLNIYGRGEPSYENSLKNLSNDCNVSNRVNFLGQVDGAEKENAFTRSDIFILPTHSENFAMVVAEALAHGVPAIVSFGAPWSEINDKGVGLWISNTPESLAKGIQSLKECDLQKMGAKGREWMVNDFTWSSRGSELVNIFKTMSRHTSPRRLKTTVS
jgi:glycosyltransferase involved in cell wall biosynthesis